MEAASCGITCDELFRGQRNADDAGGGREDFFWLAGEDVGGGFAGGAGCVEPGLARGAVGVAGVDGDDAHFAAGGAEVLLSTMSGAALTRLAGEGCGSAGGGVGDDQGEVGASALLEAGFGGSEAEAAGNDKLGKVAH